MVNYINLTTIVNCIMCHTNGSKDKLRHLKCQMNCNPQCCNISLFNYHYIITVPSYAMQMSLVLYTIKVTTREGIIGVKLVEIIVKRLMWCPVSFIISVICTRVCVCLCLCKCVYEFIHLNKFI